MFGDGSYMFGDRECGQRKGNGCRQQSIEVLEPGDCAIHCRWSVRIKIPSRVCLISNSNPVVIERICVGNRRTSAASRFILKILHGCQTKTLPDSIITIIAGFDY